MKNNDYYARFSWTELEGLALPHAGCRFKLFSSWDGRCAVESESERGERETTGYEPFELNVGSLGREDLVVR